jgi:predicted amidohydrolase
MTAIQIQLLPGDRWTFAEERDWRAAREWAERNADLIETGDFEWRPGR